MTAWNVSQVGRITFSDYSTPGQRVMHLIGEAAIDQFMADSQERGIDANGRPFRPYSKFYAAVRKAAGYSTRPDLTVDGAMFKALAVVGASDQQVIVGFNDAQMGGGVSTLMAKAWPKLGPQERNAFYKIVAASKRRAGKGRGTGPRRNPSALRNRKQGPAFSGHPVPLPSEKMLFTNKLRPWFSFGRKGSKRRAEIQRRGFNIYLENVGKH